MHRYGLSGQEKIGKDHVEQYLFLVRCIDQEVKRLLSFYAGDITCRPGCSSCCVNIAVFPVEFFAILNAIEQAGINPVNLYFNKTSSCGFLYKNVCSIYSFRPIICRTHGMPILFLNDSHTEPAWEISFCELNFPGRESIEFGSDMILDLERINTELNHINHDFIQSRPELHYNDRDRIPLKELCSIIDGLHTGKHIFFKRDIK